MFGYIIFMFLLLDYVVVIGSLLKDVVNIVVFFNLGIVLGRFLIGYVSDYFGRV